MACRLLGLALASLMIGLGLGAVAHAEPVRPTIALVLSGGGARGAAHVGVLKAIEQLRIPVDIVTGTSAGAIVGGLYAAGLSPARIEEVLQGTDWDALLQDGPSRTRRSQQTRVDDRSFLSREFAGVRDREVNAPSAMLQGQQFDLLFRNLTLAVSAIDDFDRLRVRFRALATDAVSGEAVVLGSGDLARAIRASMSVPAVFAGVEIGGRLLVDGGISNNLPVSVARDLGADIVIAVDISTPLRSREALNSVLGMMGQLTGFLTARNTADQLGRLTGRDILIRPALDKIGSTDLQDAALAVNLGEQAALQALAPLSALALDARPAVASPVGTDPVRVSSDPPSAAPIIRFVRFANGSSLREDVLRSRVSDLVGKPLDLDQLKLSIDRLYALEVFESVRYRKLEENGQTGLLIETVPRSWGLDALQFGLRLATERRRGSDFDLGIAYEARALNSLNGKWRTELQFGQTTMLATELYQPIDSSEYWFVNARLSSGETLRKLYSGGLALAEYGVARTGASLALGANFDRYGDIRVGVRRYRGETYLSVGSTDPFPNYRFQQGQAFVALELETLDSPRFPRSGAYFRVEASNSLYSLGADSQFDQIRLRSTIARSLGAHTLIGQVQAESTTGGFAPIQNRFAIGGLFTLPGYDLEALVGQHALSAGLTYLYRANNSGLLPLYLGGSWYAGDVWDGRSAVSLSSLRSGKALLLGTDSPIGPLYLGLGHSHGGRSVIYFNLGQPWF